MNKGHFMRPDLWGGELFNRSLHSSIDRDPFTWLRCSFFCDRSFQHRLLSEAMLPFVMQVQAAGYLQAWFVEFRQHRGDHIRFPLLVPSVQAPSLARDLRLFFQGYFERSAFAVAPVDYPVLNLFQPFPANSVQFGLFDLPYQAEAFDLYGVQQRIAEVMAGALTEVIDDESAFTLSLYLHLTVLKVVRQRFPNQLAPLLAYYESYHVSPSSSSSLLQHAAMLDEIRQDVEDNTAAGHAWLFSFEQLCAEWLRREAATVQGHRLIHVVNRQIGLTPALFLLIRQYICSLLQAKTVLL